MSDVPTIGQIVYVDVDDTLIRSVGHKRIPVTNVIEQVKALKRAGAELYCWSSGGAAYAKEVAGELGLTACFAGFLPKPRLIIDDQRVAEWRYCAEVHPAEIESV